MTLDEIAELFSLMREHGVKRFRSEHVEVELDEEVESECDDGCCPADFKVDDAELLKGISDSLQAESKAATIRKSQSVATTAAEQAALAGNAPKPSGGILGHSNATAHFKAPVVVPAESAIEPERFDVEDALYGAK